MKTNLQKAADPRIPLRILTYVGIERVSRGKWRVWSHGREWYTSTKRDAQRAKRFLQYHEGDPGGLIGPI